MKKCWMEGLSCACTKKRNKKRKKSHLSRTGEIKSGGRGYRSDWKTKNGRKVQFSAKENKHLFYYTFYCT